MNGGGNPLRFLLAITLMMGVLLLTNILFPPSAPDPPPVDEAAPEDASGDPPIADEFRPPGETLLPELEDEPQLVEVVTPLYRMTFSNLGATAQSIVLRQYDSFSSTREGESVELIPQGDEASLLAGTWHVGGDTVELADFAHSVTPESGIFLNAGDGSRSLTFRYDHDQGPFFSEVRYTFFSDSYLVQVEGSLPEYDRTALEVAMGEGLAVNELREADDRNQMAYVANPEDGGTENRILNKVDDPEYVEGPLRWVATKSKFFVAAFLPGTVNGEGHIAGLRVTPAAMDHRAKMNFTIPVNDDGTYVYRAYLGPIERDLLIEAADGLEEVNSYGWAIFRPIVRPLVAVILWTIDVLHEQLRLGYGWVLAVIGVLMRILLWPLNQKAMRAQIKNMAAAPKMQELKEKYGNDRERMNKEMVKLYKETGFNPMAGCLPLLLPWPMLIALFLVFRNTIQLRGEPFFWVPDLSAPDPLYILPLSMGVSMFVLQLISMRAAQGTTQQMKVMMYGLPVFMVVILWRFAAGLNFYYLVTNLAMIPQQILIAKERKKAATTQKAKAPG